MELPRFYYREYSDFQEELEKLSHTHRHFTKGEYLWKPDTYISECFYLENGIAKTFCVHESGHQRIIYFHGAGDLAPGFHSTQFKIEKSLCTTAVTELDAMCFRRETIYDYCFANRKFGAKAFEVYAKYINNLIFQTCHQEYNDVTLKLCNLLYLFCVSSDDPSHILLSQEDMANILAVNRVNIAKALANLKRAGIISSHYGWIEVLDQDKLSKYCSMESLPDL